MNKEQIEKILSRYLKQQEEIVFAYLFGSLVGQKQFRDVDVGIYSKLPKLTTLGLIQTELVQKTEKPIDLIYLNDLPGKHPSLAYQIVCTGELLFSHNVETQSDYKHRTLLTYFDTAPLRKQMKHAFNKRLRDNKFGLRDYA